MTTTEVVIEQVLVGFLVLIIVGLPFPPEPPLHWLANVPQGLSVGVGVAGVAYLLGPSFDRLADTILGGLERRARLRFAWEECRKAPLAANDPFPEADLRFDMLREGKPEALSYLDYLRSRMRVSRALAIYAPALTVSSMLGTSRFDPTVRAWVLIAVGAAYAAMAVVVELYKPPVARTCKLLRFVRTEQQGSTTPKEVRASISAVRDPLVPCCAFFVVGLVVLATLGPAKAQSGAIAASGALLTGVSGWSWGRILQTHHRFLCQFGRRQWSERVSSRPSPAP